MTTLSITISSCTARCMLESFAYAFDNDPDTMGSPSACDLAAHLGVRASEALAIAELAVTDPECTYVLSYPGFIYKK